MLRLTSDIINYFPNIFAVRKVHTRISTIELSHSILISGYAPFETCVFFSGESDVVATYYNRDDAILGHMKIAESYGAATVKIGTKKA